MAEITGTFDDEYLVGTDLADRIVDLLGGDDRMRGGAGDDFLLIDRPSGLHGSDLKLFGDAGADKLMVAGPGDNELRVLLSGGEGDDHVVAYDVGFARIEGGDGKDIIEAVQLARGRIGGGLGDDIFFINFGGLTVIAAGDGKDWLFIDRGLGRTFADMGAGDDVVRVAASAADDRTILTLGAGRDVVYLDPDADTLTSHPTTIIIRDFETGYARDRFDAGAFLRAAGITTADPFDSDHLRLVQREADVVLQLDRDADATAYGWETLVRFHDADAASFVPFNLGAPILWMLPPSDVFAADLAALTV